MTIWKATIRLPGDMRLTAIQEHVLGGRIGWFTMEVVA